MTEQNKKQLLSLLDEYYREQAKTCDYNCCTCRFGVLRDYGYGHSCAIEFVSEVLGVELYYLNEVQ